MNKFAIFVFIGTAFWSGDLWAESNSKPISRSKIECKSGNGSIIPCPSDALPVPIPSQAREISFVRCEPTDFESTIQDFLEQFEIVKSTKIEFLCATYFAGSKLVKLSSEDICKEDFCPVFAETSSNENKYYLFDYLKGDPLRASSNKEIICSLAPLACRDTEVENYDSYKTVGWVKFTDWHFFINSKFDGIVPVTLTPSSVRIRSEQIINN